MRPLAVTGLKIGRLLSNRIWPGGPSLVGLVFYAFVALVSGALLMWGDPNQSETLTSTEMLISDAFSIALFVGGLVGVWYYCDVLELDRENPQLVHRRLFWTRRHPVLQNLSFFHGGWATPVWQLQVDTGKAKPARFQCARRFRGRPTEVMRQRVLAHFPHLDWDG